MIGAQTGINCGGCKKPTNCLDKFGCPTDMCPDTILKRHDTMPSFKVEINDCDGALDLSDTSLIVEASMWANAKLKKNITSEDGELSLADNVGFEQIMSGDIIVMDRIRSPEHMLVTGFDEASSLIFVQRGYNGTLESDWKKGTPLKIFRFMGSSAEISLVYDDITQEDGTIKKDQLIQSFLTYNWTANNTCLPGCFWLEFKLLKIKLLDEPIDDAPLNPSLVYGCDIGANIEWIRRFPSDGEGFLIKIQNSYTPEMS